MFGSLVRLMVDMVRVPAIIILAVAAGILTFIASVEVLKGGKDSIPLHFLIAATASGACGLVLLRLWPRCSAKHAMKGTRSQDLNMTDNSAT